MMSGRNYRSIAAVGRRFLSSTSGTEAGANGERGSMVEFMKNIAEKRKTEGAVEAAPSLWAKLNKEVENKQAETQRERPSFPRRDNNDARNGGRGGNTGRGNNNLGGRGYSNNGGRGGSAGGRGGGGAPSAGRGYNTRNTGGRANFVQNGGGRGSGGRGGRGGGRGGGGGGGRSGALRTLGGDDNDEYEGQGRAGGRRAREGDEEGDDEGPQKTSEMELFGVENGNPYYDHGSLPDAGGQPLDEADELILFDTDYFENALDEMDNVRINTKGQDVLEQVLAHAFIESIKTPDNRYIEELDMPNRKRVQLPEPRSMVQLYNYTQPPVLQNSKPDDEGVALAQQAWGVIHQNYYHSDLDKYRMVEGVATLHRKMLKVISEIENNPAGVDLIFQPQFRKGCEYEEEEERLAALNKIAPNTEVAFEQAETDWSVEAVVDEDQL